MGISPLLVGNKGSIVESREGLTSSCAPASPAFTLPWLLVRELSWVGAAGSFSSQWCFCVFLEKILVTVKTLREI